MLKQIGKPVVFENDTLYPSLLFFSLEKKCNDKVINYLMTLREDVNISNVLGVTPLLLSLSRKSNAVSRMLINSGADVNLRTRNGFTYLHEVIEIGDFDTVCMLLYYGIDVNARDNQGRNAFEYALVCNEYDIALHLIEYVADFNEKGSEGFTALHTALRCCPKMVEKIIEKGGDVNIPWFGTHSIQLCLWWHSTSKPFETIWPLVDFEVYLKLHDIRELFQTLVGTCRFRKREFMRCLYVIFTSDHARDIFRSVKKDESQESNLMPIIERLLSVDEITEVVAILLSYGGEFYFNDLCFLYQKYGFHDCVQRILISGCFIYPSSNPSVNLIVCKICYNNLDIYAQVRHMLFCNSLLSVYRHFYKLKFDSDAPFIETSDVPPVNKVKSLVQLGRDVVRDVVYKAQSKEHAFNVYQAFLQLPVPKVIVEILFLKQGVY